MSQGTYSDSTYSDSDVNMNRVAGSNGSSSCGGSGSPEPEAGAANRAVKPLSYYGELARAYVPVQIYGERFSPAEALMRGTVFPELYRPYEPSLAPFI
ncbi:MAG: spore coat associated protein CotJA [Firmicutes bacterium]|nr:spore coat associated protein CotJA [Bacillota bacterium]